MASGPITSWQIEVETMETFTDFILAGTANSGSEMYMEPVPFLKQDFEL